VIELHRTISIADGNCQIYALDISHAPSYRARWEVTFMRADDVHPSEILRHGAYLCLNLPSSVPRAAAAAGAAAVTALAGRLGLCNEFEAAAGDPPDAIAFLRRVGATPAGLADDRLLAADAVVHVASAREDLVAELCTELCAEVDRFLGPSGSPSGRPLVLRGVLRPTNFTGNAMHNFAYAHRVLQQPGTVHPHAFLVPTSKTAAWWEKGWMERHTYFLPRYDDSGKMLAEGHALAAAPGIACLMRRTYKHPAEPAPPGAYDFLNYFECADADVPTFHQVCAALRDVARNPEWKFVREGPTWHGRRVATWAELFA
jgi:hypothetical protein